MQWWIQANHGGRIGLKLCPRNTNVDQACFDRYPLTRWVSAYAGAATAMYALQRTSHACTRVCNKCTHAYLRHRADIAGERFVYIMGPPLPPGSTAATLGTMSANYRLPAGVSCSGGCVLQWGEWLHSRRFLCARWCMHLVLHGLTCCCCCCTCRVSHDEQLL